MKRVVPRINQRAELRWAGCLAAVGALIASVTLEGAETFQAPFGPGGSWHVYELVESPATWSDAWEQASVKQWAGVDGRLADIESAAENGLLEYLANQPIWIGLTDREGVVEPVFRNGFWTPQESRWLPNPRRNGWSWTSGRPVDFIRWGQLQPNDLNAQQDAVEMRPDGLWYDERSGFVEDGPLAPVFQPGSSLDEQGASPKRAGYVVEYPLGSATPLAGVPIYEPIARMPARLAGMEGGRGTLGLTEYRGDFSSLQRIQDISAWLADQSDTIPSQLSFQTAITKTDLSHLAELNSGGPVLRDRPLDFPSASSRDVGASRISVAKGSIYVPLAGTYTFQVHSSSGFALKVGNATFEAAGRSGMIDAADPGVLYFPLETGDSDARGVVTLSAGSHEFQFYSWSHDPLSYWEITSAWGDFRRRDDLHWSGLGDGTVTPPTPKGSAPLTLLQPATIVNVPSSQGGNVLSSQAAETAVKNAIQRGEGLRRDDVTSVVLRDDDGIVFRRGASLEDHETTLLPINDPLVGGSISPADRFSTGVFGQFAVDDGDETAGEMLQVSIHLQANERAQLRVLGADFLKSTLTGRLEEHPDGGVQLVSSPTLQTADVIGLIELQEGFDYPFEAFSYDLSGDAGLEIWSAWGDHTGANFLDPLDAFPLTTSSSARIIPANIGLTFVPSQFVATTGDYNGNGTFDVADLDLQAIAMQSSDLAYDLNRDSRIDLADRLNWLHDYARTVAGDANLDGRFTSADLVLVLQSGLYESDEGATWSDGDFNGDFRFDTSDLLVALQDGYYEMNHPWQAALTPEPSGVACFWIGLMALIRLRRSP